MANFPAPPNNTRLGFHYFPDAEHYRESDLRLWLPELGAIGATWLVLLAPPRRAIPEYFLSGLLAEGIEPVLHFPIPLFDFPPVQDLAVLFKTYARWGLNYVVLFDRPNSRVAWSTNAWAQNDLVERFLDCLIPVASAAIHAGLRPVFPPLEPGGGYWDTAFLRAAIQGLARRCQPALLDRLVLSAYAPAGDRPLNWGSGGPERWPDARPYATPPGVEDQRGFRIFEWYSAIAQAAAGREFPFFLLGAGSQPSSLPGRKSASLNEASHIQRNLAIAGAAVSRDSQNMEKSAHALENNFSTFDGETLDPIPPQVLSINYWLLSAGQENPHSANAWFAPDGTPRPAAKALRLWAAKTLAGSSGGGRKSMEGGVEAGQPRPISHYLLLPAYEWGVSEWHLSAIKPFIQKHRPAIGFSLEEAACAHRVTVVGGEGEFPEEALDELRASGCVVDRVRGPGTQIASQLADHS